MPQCSPATASPPSTTEPRAAFRTPSWARTSRSTASSRPPRCTPAPRWPCVGWPSEALQHCVARRSSPGRAAMKLVTFDEGRVGRVEGDEIVVLDVPTMRAWFERGGAEETGERPPLDEVRLRAPIVPKKFFHTAGNFREHEEESKRVDWSHEIAPWIVFFQNVDALVGPDDPVVYPEHLTEELDYELELAVVIGKPGKWFG